MWAEFEWENKVSVQSNITDMNQYLEHILTSTNMRCLTPKQVFVVITVSSGLIFFMGYHGYYWLSRLLLVITVTIGFHGYLPGLCYY